MFVCLSSWPAGFLSLCLTIKLAVFHVHMASCLSVTLPVFLPSSFLVYLSSCLPVYPYLYHHIYIYLGVILWRRHATCPSKILWASFDIWDKGQVSWLEVTQAPQPQWMKCPHLSRQFRDVISCKIAVTTATIRWWGEDGGWGEYSRMQRTLTPWRRHLSIFSHNSSCCHSLNILRSLSPHFHLC